MNPLDYDISDKKIVADKTLSYLYFMDKNHPLRSKAYKVYYHRHVASVKIGRWLRSREVVHHIDGDRQNNKPENLEVVESHSEHMKIHHPEKEMIHCGVCGKLTRNFKYCCPACCAKGCEKAIWPSDEELQSLVLSVPYTKIGLSLGVSDNAVRGFAKRRGLTLFRGPRNKK